MSSVPNYHQGSPEEAFGLPPASIETVLSRVVHQIVNSWNGECYTNLKKQYGDQIRNFLPALARNNYAKLDQHKLNFDEIESMNITFAKYPCYCKKRQCRRYVALNRSVDPEQDIGVKATYRASFKPMSWKMSHQEFIESLHDFFDDQENLLARQIDQFIEEEWMENESESVVVNIEDYLGEEE